MFMDVYGVFMVFLDFRLFWVNSMIPIYHSHAKTSMTLSGRLASIRGGSLSADGHRGHTTAAQGRETPGPDMP